MLRIADRKHRKQDNGFRKMRAFESNHRAFQLWLRADLLTRCARNTNSTPRTFATEPLWRLSVSWNRRMAQNIANISFGQKTVFNSDIGQRLALGECPFGHGRNTRIPQFFEEDS